MDPQELERAFAGESDRIEWKETERDTEKLLRSTCALANDLGGSGSAGWLLIGVNNGGRVVGADTSDKAIRALVDRLTSKLVPSPSIDVLSRSREGKSLLVVVVQPYPVPPLVTVDGVPWVRVGTETRRATHADITRLQERRPIAHQPFDIRPLAGTTIEDLNCPRLQELYAVEKATAGDGESYPSFKPWLGQRELARLSDGRWTPTAAGVLLYGISPQRHLPGAVVEFVRYAGGDYDAPVVSRKRAEGTLPDQLETLWTQIEANTADVPVPATGIRTPYVPEYPLEALKELARNLVQHRLYEGTNAPGRVSWLADRIVFNNPGNPYGQASQGEFGEHSDYRNPTLTRGLAELGYVERLGRGIRLARKRLADNGNPTLEVETDGFTTVTVRKGP